MVQLQYCFERLEPTRVLYGFNRLAATLPFAFVLALCVAPFVMALESEQQHLQQGNELMMRSQYEKALKEFKKAIQQNKNNPDYYQLCAQAEMAMKEYKPAIGFLNKAIKLDPARDEFVVGRAQAFQTLGNYAKAKKDLDHVVDREPDNGTVLLQRGCVSFALGKPKSSIEDCDRALRTSLGRTQLIDLYRLRSDAYRKLGRKREAEQELAKYNSLMP